MDPLTGRALLEYQKEVNRKIVDSRGSLESQKYPRNPQRPVDQALLAQFMQEEQAYRNRRFRKLRRQTFVWALIGALLPLFAFILRYLHIQGWFGN